MEKLLDTLGVNKYDLIIDKYKYDGISCYEVVEKQINNLDSFDLSNAYSKSPTARFSNNEIQVNLAAITQCFFEMFTKEIVATINGAVSSFWDFLKMYFSSTKQVSFLQTIEEELREPDKIVLVALYLIITENSMQDFTFEFFQFERLREYYSSKSDLVKNKANIIFFSEQLSRYNLSHVSSSLQRRFKKYKTDLEKTLSARKTYSSLFSGIEVEDSSSRKKNLFTAETNSVNDAISRKNSDGAFASNINSMFWQEKGKDSSPLEEADSFQQSEGEEDKFTEGVANIAYYHKEERKSRTYKRKLSPQIFSCEFSVKVRTGVDDCLKEDFYTFENKPSLSQKTTFFNTSDRYISVVKKFNPDKFSNRDIVHFKSTNVTMTNSVVYYLNHFYKKHKIFRFHNDCASKPNITVLP